MSSFKCGSLLMQKASASERRVGSKSIAHYQRHQSEASGKMVLKESESDRRGSMTMLAFSITT